jgi:hypothetical protein
MRKRTRIRRFAIPEGLCSSVMLVGAWNVIPSDSQVTGIMAASRAKARGPEDWLAKASTDPGGMYSKFYLPHLRQTIDYYRLGDLSSSFGYTVIWDILKQ